MKSAQLSKVVFVVLLVWVALPAVATAQTRKVPAKQSAKAPAKAVKAPTAPPPVALFLLSMGGKTGFVDRAGKLASSP